MLTHTLHACKHPIRFAQIEMRMLEDRVDAIHREAMYQREREEAHRSTNESTNTRVVWYSVGTIVAVLVVSVLQMADLYR